MISRGFINGLVTITLVEMMFSIGLNVTLTEVIRAAGNWRRLARALSANYLVVPTATLLLTHVVLVDSPGVTLGLLLLAVFPGASYGPPFTRFAKGDLPLAVGLMVLLAASSVLIGPILLRLLLALMKVETSFTIDVLAVIGSLTLTQLLPLSGGMLVCQHLPGLAQRLRNPAEIISRILNGAVIACVLASHGKHSTLLQIPVVLVMFGLLFLSLAGGYLLGGPGHESRKAVSQTTALRNVGVCILMASGPSADPVALATVVSYAILELTGSLLVALWWGWRR